MNKTVSINLGGQVFQIDEHAYERLWRYLESIKARYANTKGGDDIIWDIENRLAEMFYEYMGTARNVITMADVEQTITVMGRPEDFEIPLEDEEPTFASTKTTADKKQRRLFRNGEDKVVGGVASGLSLYLGIQDPIWMRIIFVIALFGSFGTSMVVYIILVIIIPEAKTAAEKLQMRGEPINIDNIERTVRDELNDLDNRLHNGKNRGALSRGLDYVATGMRVIFVILAKLIGFGLAALGVLMLLSLILGISIPSVVKGGFSISMLSHLFNSQGALVTAVLGFGLLLLIPIISLIYSGLAILINRPMRYRGLGLAAFGMLIIGLMLTIYSISSVKSEFDVKRSKTETVTLSPPIDGILRLQLSHDPRNTDDFRTLTGFGLLREENDTLFVRNNSIDTEDKPIVIDVVRSPSRDFLLETTFSAEGDESEIAHLRTQNMRYQLTQDSAHLYFPAYFTYPVKDKIRNQKVKIILKVPEGQSIFLSKDIRELIYDIKNVTNMYDGDMVGHTWKMMPGGLTCTDCGPHDGMVPPTAPMAPTAPSPPSSALIMQVQAFTTLKVEGAIKFFLLPANETRIVFEEPDMQKDITVDTDGNRLTISTASKFELFGKDVTLWIYTPEVEKVILTGATEGQISGFAPKNLHVELAGASECDLNVEAENLSVHVSGASDISIAGRTTQLDAEVAGASELNAFGLVSNKVKIHTSGASNAEVFAIDNLDAEAAGASSIDYKGSPKVSSASSGASSINAKL